MSAAKELREYKGDRERSASVGLAWVRSETVTLAQNIVWRQLWFAAVLESYDAGMHERKLTRQTGVTDHVREYQPRGER